MVRVGVAVVALFTMPAWATTDYLAPGTPATVGQNGSVLGKDPDHPIPAPRGVLSTLGRPEKQVAPATHGARLKRADVISRLQAAGYAGIIDLSENGSGVWLGTARKAGKTVRVRCDGTGAITEG